MARVALTDDNGALYGAPAEWLNGRFTPRDEMYQVFDDYQMVSGPHVSGTGDSLTAGAGGNGVSWPSTLQDIVANAYSDPGTVHNLGVGGETSATISGRVGIGNPWHAIVSGGTIPATGGVTVTLRSEDGTNVNPLIQSVAGVNPVHIAGVVGTLTQAGGVYTFTRSTDGAAVTVTEPQPVSTKSNRERQSDLFVMWWGQNDNPQDETVVIRRQRATINRLRAFRKRWIVLGLSTGSDTSRAAMDAAFAAEYGDRFLNIRKYLSSDAALSAEGITPTAEDTTAISEGSVPPSLLSDPIHLNSAGYRRVGRAIYEKIKLLGWNDLWGDLGDDTDVRLPVTFFSDDFDRADGDLAGSVTPIGGKTWALTGSPTAVIESGAARLSVASGEGMAVVGGSRDGVVEATVRTVGAAKRPLLLLRFANSSGYLYIDGDTATPGNYRLRSKIGTAYAVIADLGVVPADGDQIRVTLNGATGTVSVNGTQLFSGTIPEISGGTLYGFMAYTSTGDVVWESIKMSENA